MKVLCVEGTWVVRTKGEIDPQVTYSGCQSLKDSNETKMKNETNDEMI